MTTPKTHKKCNKNKKMNVCKKATASLAIGEIEKNTDTFILTYGQFSLIDALVAILAKTGPAHVIISTWTAAHAHLDRSMALMESADISSLKMIVDRSFRQRQLKYFDHMIDLFGTECVREISTHAKFMVIRNEKYDIVVRTSMNLNGNPRLENIEISENSDFADFFENIVNEIFKEVPPSFSMEKTPVLEDVQDFPLFKTVDAKNLKSKNLKEVSYTHEIRN